MEAGIGQARTRDVTVGSFEGGAQHNEPGNRTIMLEHSHLVIELYNFKFW